MELTGNFEKSFKGSKPNLLLILDLVGDFEEKRSYCMKRMTSIEAIQTTSFEKEKKPLKKLRINVKMTKECFIDSFAVSHVAFLHSTKIYPYTPCISLYSLWIIK